MDTIPALDWSNASDAQRELAVALAIADGDEIELQPVLIGFLGEHAMVLVALRPFPRGDHLDAIIEALALVVPFGCDRLSLGMPSRAWSMVDPVAPVTDDADLRQRVLLELRADHADQSSADSLLHPFDVTDGNVRWQPTVDLGPGEGELGVLLPASLGIPGGRAPDELVAQLQRLEERGHLVAFSERGQRRLLRLLESEPHG